MLIYPLALSLPLSTAIFCFDLYLSFNFQRSHYQTKGSRRCHRPVRRDAGGRRISFGEHQWDYSQGLFWAFLSMLAWTGLIITEKLVMNRGVTPDASCAYEGLFSW